MKVIDPSFTVCEEILETILHFTKNEEHVSEKLIYGSIGKTAAYVKKGADFLIYLGVLSSENGNLTIKHQHFNKSGEGNLLPISILKKALTTYPPFKEYCKLIQSGKKENTTLKLIKATYKVENDINEVKKVFDKWLKYLQTEIKVIPVTQNKVSNVPTSENYFWIDEHGHLIYDEAAHTKRIVEELEKSRYKNPVFIDNTRIESIKNASSPSFDLSKLVKLCQELNDAYRVGNYFSVGVLTRAILDHIPPIFNKKSFTEVANNHGSKSFKDVMSNLENFSRKIADSILHSHIQRKESLPNSTTVDCKNALDVLLGEIINELK